MYDESSRVSYLLIKDSFWPARLKVRWLKCVPLGILNVPQMITTFIQCVGVMQMYLQLSANVFKHK